MFALAATMAKDARWLVCDYQPGRPSGGTVRVHRRPCGPASPDRATPETDRRRTPVHGCRPSPARLPLDPPLDPLRPRPTGPPLPLPTPTIRLQQAPQRRRPTDLDRDPGIGQAGTHPARQPAADRLHPATVCRLPRDRQTFRVGRTRRLRLLPQPFPLLLGVSALPADHRRRHARLLVPGQPEPVRHGRLARVRQWIEAVFDTLKASSAWNNRGCGGSTRRRPPSP